MDLTTLESPTRIKVEKDATAAEKPQLRIRKIKKCHKREFSEISETQSASTEIQRSYCCSHCMYFIIAHLHFTIFYTCGFQFNITETTTSTKKKNASYAEVVMSAKAASTNQPQLVKCPTVVRIACISL